MNLNTSDTGHAVIAKAIDRHGGNSAFSSFEEISICIKRMGGIIPVAKGLNRTFSFPDRIVVRPHSKVAIFKYDDGDIVFDNGSIITSTKSINRYRETFSGFRKLRFWTNNDAAYFFGYSLIHYFSLPFSLTSLETHRAFLGNGGVSWVEKIFPDAADTHSRIQRFWFDPSGLLFRHDYRADIIGPMFYGSHFSHEYRFDLPVPIAHHRVVRARIGNICTPIPVLDANIITEQVMTFKEDINGVVLGR